MRIERWGGSVSVNFKDVSYIFPVFYILISRISQNLFSVGGTSRMLNKHCLERVLWPYRFRSYWIKYSWGFFIVKYLKTYNVDIIWISGMIGNVFQTCLNMQFCFFFFFFNGGKRAKLLGLVLFGTYFGKMLGHALLYLRHCLLAPQGNSKLCKLYFVLSFFILPEINKVAVNLALFSNHSSSLERKYTFVLLF